MRAIVTDGAGGTEVLRLDPAYPDPGPGPGELLVRVATAGVNRADLLQRMGFYPPPPGSSSPLIGMEVCGTVEAHGPDVPAEAPAVGTRVAALLASGGYAELAVAGWASCVVLPDEVDDTQGGGLVETYLTAFDNVLLRARLSRGETLLVHGGSSGVGTSAIQLAKRIGATVAVTVGSQEKADACRALGADHTFLYREEDWVEGVVAATGGNGADVVLDVMGAKYLDQNLRSLAREGRLVIIGLQGGTAAELDLRRLMDRRASVMGSTLRARTTAEKAALVARFSAEALPGFVDGSLRVVVDSVVPLADVAQAHDRMAASSHIGKIVLQVG